MKTAFNSWPTTLVKFRGYDFYYDVDSGFVLPGNVKLPADCKVDQLTSIRAEQADDSMTPNIKMGDCLENVVLELGTIHTLSEGVYGVMRRKHLFDRHTVQIGRLLATDMPVSKTLTLWADNATHGHLTVPIEDILCLFRVKAVVWDWLV